MISARSTFRGQYGFTLVEMLVYMAIFVIFATAAVSFLISFNGLIGQYRLETALHRSGSNVMEHILLAIRQADSVDLGNTIEHSPSNGQLAVLNDAGSTWFTLTGGALHLTLDGTDLGDLTGDDVSVDDFTVYHYSYGDGEFVRVRITLTGLVDGITKSVTLYGGAVVRGAL